MIKIQPGMDDRPPFVEQMRALNVTLGMTLEQ